MDPLIILLLVIIVFAGGCIGMLADHLGRKIGKKKLSLRSMRPKHVARLGTFLAGICISIFTIVLVFFTSSDVREWIIRGRQAIKDSAALTSKNAQLQGDIASKTTKIDQLDAEAKAARLNLQRTQSNLNAVQADLSSANQKLASASKRVEEGKQALARNQVLLRNNQALLVKRQGDLARVGANLKAAKARYATLQANFSVVNKERNEADQAVSDLRNTRDMLTGEITQLRKDSAQLKQDKEDAKLALKNAQSELTDAEQELDGVRRSLRTAREELDLAEQQQIKLQSVAAATHRQRMVYQFGQEVQRLAVGPHLSARQARQVFSKLMSEADVAARALGAAPQSSARAVILPPLQGVVPGHYEDEIVASITGQDQETVLIAQAFVNTFTGEQVPVQIIQLPNPVVYHKNDLVAELRVGRNWPGAKVLTQFNDFMQQQVHDKIKEKMIPVAGDQASLISLAPAETFDVVERFTRSLRDTVLEVRAHSETRAADSLQLDFKYK